MMADTKERKRVTKMESLFFQMTQVICSVTMNRPEMKMHKIPTQLMQKTMSTKAPDDALTMVPQYSIMSMRMRKPAEHAQIMNKQMSKHIMCKHEDILEALQQMHMKT
jgi:hypothetical protein